MHAERLDGDFQRNIVLQRHELTRDACLLGKLDELFTTLGLLDLAGARQQRIKITVGGDELGSSLDADARHARHIVDRIPRESLHIDDLFRRHAELLDHIIAANALGFHAVQHRDAGAHELHQVFVGRDDGDVTAGIDHRLGIRRDQVVGLIPIELDARHVEGLHGVTNERELRDELFRRRRPLRLVFRIDVVAEGVPSSIENNGDVRRRFRDLALAQKLPQHLAEAVHGADRQPVRRPGQRRQRVEGAEDVARPINEIDVAALDNGQNLTVRHG